MDLQSERNRQFEFDVTTELVRKVQNALMTRGYEVGPAGADNILGSDTKSALVKFQKDNGLPVGALDFETLKSFRCKIDFSHFT